MTIWEKEYGHIGAINSNRSSTSRVWNPHISQCTHSQSNISICQTPTDTMWWYSCYLPAWVSALINIPLHDNVNHGSYPGSYHIILTLTTFVVRSTRGCGPIPVRQPPNNSMLNKNALKFGFQLPFQIPLWVWCPIESRLLRNIACGAPTGGLFRKYLVCMPLTASE